jgi:CheY-like chemotaxis protein
VLGFPVLIVDDEPQVRSLIRAVLSRAGFRVLVAGNGVDALSTAQTLHGEICIMVSDYSMPGMNGNTLAGLLKEQFPLIPTLLMSSGSNACDCPSADAFLAKPFVPSVLVASVHRLLGMEEE